MKCRVVTLHTRLITQRKVLLGAPYDCIYCEIVGMRNRMFRYNNDTIYDQPCVNNLQVAAKTNAKGECSLENVFDFYGQPWLIATYKIISVKHAKFSATK